MRMKISSKVRRFAGRPVKEISLLLLSSALGVNLCLSLFSVSGHAQDYAARKSSADNPLVQDTAAAGETRPAEPSLGHVLELLQAQEQEISELRAALRHQQELTASLSAKLDSAGVGVSVAPAVAIVESGATPAQGDLSQRVVRVETSLQDSQ
jgi:hypothetical protein